MTKKLRIYRPAIKLKDGRLEVAPRPGMTHKELQGVDSAGSVRGFVTSEGDWVGREDGAKIAVAAGQVDAVVKRLHSEDLPEYKRKK